jgi:hypothetical protein
MKNNFEFKTLQEFAQHAIQQLKDGLCNDAYASDMHNIIFNDDYYVIGYYNAEQWLIANTGVFNGISIVQEYELDNFGAISTDLTSSESIVNMLAYIGGEEVLLQSKAITNCDNILSNDLIIDIIDELTHAYSL